MVSLNLPPANLKIKSKENKQFIFDIIRKKYVVMNPEEWVRQHIVHFLVNFKKYPTSLIAVEKEILVNTRKKRFDILVFNKEGRPSIIIECKAPKVKITQDTFDQISRYNIALQASMLMVSNGLEHFACILDFKNEGYNFIKELPSYQKS